MESLNWRLFDERIKTRPRHSYPQRATNTRPTRPMELHKSHLVTLSPSRVTEACSMFLVSTWFAVAVFILIKTASACGSRACVSRMHQPIFHRRSFNIEHDELCTSAPTPSMMCQNPPPRSSADKTIVAAVIETAAALLFNLNLVGQLIRRMLRSQQPIPRQTRLGW